MIRGLLKFVAAMLLLLIVLILLLAFLPTRWLADKLEVYGSEFLGADLQIGSLELNILSLEPSISFGESRLQSPTAAGTDSKNGGQFASFEIGRFSGSVDLGSMLSGDLLIEKLVLEDAVIDLGINASGEPDWAYLLGSEPKADAQETARPPAIPAIRDARLDNVRLLFNDQRHNRQAELTIAASGSTINAGTPAIVSAVGTLNGLDSKIEVEAQSAEPFSIPPEAIDLTLESRIGESRVSVTGSIGEPATFRQLALEFSVAANGLEDFQTLSGIKLPSLPPFTLNGELHDEGEEYVLRRFDGILGDSDIEGDIRVNPATSPPTLYANVISRQLDLDDLAGLFGGTPDTGETATEQQKVQAQDNAVAPRLLPTQAITLRPLLQLFNGAVQYRAESVMSPVWPVDSIDVRAEINAADVSLSPFQVGLGGGSLAGAVYLDLAAQPMKTLTELQITRVNLRQVMISLGVDDDSFGIIGGRLKYWASGDSVAELAASADGGVFLLMTEGKLDALITELVGADLTESIILLLNPGKTLTNINCAYLDLHSKDGVTSISTLVMDTDDSVLLAEGSIDFSDESLDITLEPHPKDNSILAAQTAAYIGGTLKDITVRPGKTLYARAAAAALLAAIATPAAALIPFIEAGTGEDSAYCTGMVEALDDAR